MAKRNSRFRGWVMHLSSKERRKKKLDDFIQESKRLRKMCQDELNFEYIETKSKLEHKKNILSLFIISVSLAILMNAWSKFFSFMQLALQYVSTTSDNNDEVIMVSFVVSVLIVIVLTVTVIFFILDFSKDIMLLQKKLMLIESIMKEKVS